MLCDALRCSVTLEFVKLEHLKRPSCPDLAFNFPTSNVSATLKNSLLWKPAIWLGRKGAVGKPSSPRKILERDARFPATFITRASNVSGSRWFAVTSLPTPEPDHRDKNRQEIVVRTSTVSSVGDDKCFEFLWHSLPWTPLLIRSPWRGLHEILLIVL